MENVILVVCCEFLLLRLFFKQKKVLGLFGIVWLSVNFKIETLIAIQKTFDLTFADLSKHVKNVPTFCKFYDASKFGFKKTIEIYFTLKCHLIIVTFHAV
jgi:hypothetical protein